MIKSLNDCYKLNNGVEIPAFGFGTYGLKIEDECKQAVEWAIEAGYRSIDTASAYKNEDWVGTALKKTGIKREDLFITTKVWNGEQGYDDTMAAFERSINKLQTDYLDMYLIHWPVPMAERYTETFQAMVDLMNQGKIRAVGVSNFYKEHIENIIEATGVVPAVNQLEFHPWLQERELTAYMKEKGILLEAWSPLVRGQILGEEPIVSIAAKYGKTTAQVILRWDIQKGAVTIPRSSKQQRIKENMDIFDFELTAEEMSAIDAMDKGYRTGFDANTYDRDANYKK